MQQKTAAKTFDKELGNFQGNCRTIHQPPSAKVPCSQNLREHICFGKLQGRQTLLVFI